MTSAPKSEAKFGYNIAIPAATLAAFSVAPFTVSQSPSDNSQTIMTNQQSTSVNPGAAAGQSQPSVDWLKHVEQTTDLKIKLVEAEIDNKFERLISKIDKVASSVEVSHKALTQEVAAVNSNFAELKTQVSGVSSEARGANRTVVATIVTTGVAIVALTVAIAGFGAQVLDLAQGLFSAGAATKK